jgi:RHS repeat-associated protein
VSRVSRWLKQSETYWSALVGSKVADTQKRSRLQGYCPLEDRVVPDGRPLPLPVIYVGAETGAPPLVKGYDAETGKLLFERTVYESTFTGGVRIGAADFNGDGYPDLVVGPGHGGAPRIRILDGKTGDSIHHPLGDFYAFDKSFTGGVEVDAADFNGDGHADLLVGAGKGGGPHVKVFDGQTGAIWANVMAFDPDFRGGVSIAAGDFTGDGVSEFVVGAGPGGGPHVKIYSVATGEPIAGPLGNFFAFDENYRGGIHVGSDWKTGDVTGDGRADLAVGTGPDLAPIVKIYDGLTGALDRILPVFDSAMQAGVRVGMAFVTDDVYADIVVATGPGVTNQVRVYDGKSNQQLAGNLGQYQPFGNSINGVTLATTNDPPVEPPVTDLPYLDFEPGVYEITQTGPTFGFSSATPSGTYVADVHFAGGNEVRANGSILISGQNDFVSLRNALTGYVDVTISGQTISYPVAPETVGFSVSDYRPFLLTGDGQGNFTLAFEDNPVLNGSSDWDYNDLTWTFASVPLSQSPLVAMPTANPAAIWYSQGTQNSGEITIINDGSTPSSMKGSTVPVYPSVPQAPLPTYPPPPVSKGTISGRVWSDSPTTNGTEDSSEIGIDNVVVQVFDTNGGRHAWMVTQKGGYYSFPGQIPYGEYTVHVTLLANAKFSDYHANKNTTIDSDIEAMVSTDTGRTMSIIVDANKSNHTDIDAGILLPPPPPTSPPTLPPLPPTGKIEGRVWADSAATNGKEDVGELGIRDHVVELVDDTGLRISSTRTDPYGKYSFPYVPLGEYRVQVALPSDAKFSTPHAHPDITTDSDIVETFTLFGRSNKINVTALTLNYADIDAGILLPPPPPLGTITGRVWSDQSSTNGTENSGEPGIRSHAVFLVDVNGNLAKSTRTDNDGNYSFSKIDLGKYTVHVGLPTNAVFSNEHANSDKTIDSDIVDSVDSVGWTLPITIDAANLVHTHIDAGILLPPPPPPPPPIPTGVVSGMVWNDGETFFGFPLMSDGVRTMFEAGVAGILVQLVPDFLGFPGPGKYFQSTYTDEFGRYTFNNVPNQRYQVEFTVPNSAWFSPFRVGGDPTVDSDVYQVQHKAPYHVGRTPSFFVATAGGQYTNVHTNVDAGITYSTGSGTISGKVWDDSKTLNNVSNDINDSPLAGIMVGLSKSDLSSTLWTTTNASGQYTFANLPTGLTSQYQVTFKLPTGYDFVLPNQKTSNPFDNDELYDSDVIWRNTFDFGGTDFITLTTPSPSMTNVDAGMIQVVPVNLLNVVTVEAIDDRATETQSPVDNAVLRFVRSPNQYAGIEQGLNVSFTLDGDAKWTPSATPERDYRLFYEDGGAEITTTIVSFKPNQAAFNVIVKAIDDTVSEGIEYLSVTLDVSSNNSYLVSGSPAIAYIDDNDKSTMIQGRVFVDSTINGLQWDDGPDSGLVNTVVTLYKADVLNKYTISQSKTTDSLGQYTFVQLQPGNYKVHFAPPGSRVFTLQDVQNNSQDTIDSDANIEGWTGTITVTSNSYQARDAGVLPNTLPPVRPNEEDCFLVPIVDAFGSGSAGPSSTLESGVRNDGVVRIIHKTLDSTIPGVAWGQNWTWSNGTGYADVNAGAGGVVSEMMRLIQAAGTSTLALISDSSSARYFDLVGSTYQGRFFDRGLFTALPGTLEFRYIDSNGNRFLFNDFSTSFLPAQRGRLKSITDVNGNTTVISGWHSNGSPSLVERVDALSGAGERYAYTYDSTSQLTGITQLRRLSAASSWETIRTVEYAYRTNNTLGLTTIKNALGQVIDKSYYRYYSANQSGGYENAIKMVLGVQAFERLVFDKGNAGSLITLDELTDADIKSYADQYFEYDSLKRVTKTVLSGSNCSICSASGQGTFTLEYRENTVGGGVNTWKLSTKETRPDGSTRTIYTNYAGQVLFSVLKDTESLNWFEYSRYDDAGRLVLHANSSAIKSNLLYEPHLIDSSESMAQILRSVDGLIRTYTYAATTTATSQATGDVAGYVKSTAVQRGLNGTPVKQSEVRYRFAGDSQTVVPVESTQYRNDNGTGAETTTLNYTWQGSTARPTIVSTLLPIISTAQNGSGVATSTSTAFDSQGRPIWWKDALGVLSYIAYDPKTGSVIKSIQDVDTTRTSEFTGLPAGWTTPAAAGRHLVSINEVDLLGRTVKSVAPDGRVDYTVYNDTLHEIRRYFGWNSTTNRPTGPTSVIRDDRGRGYWESLTMSALPTLDANGRPTGTEAISAIETLYREYRNLGGQTTKSRQYFNMNGLTYSPSADLGTENLHYYLTRYDYAKQVPVQSNVCLPLSGLINRIISPDGTIRRTEYDSLGRAISQWVGTDDTNTLGFWNTDDLTGTDMVKLVEYEYDYGGIGDGNLTRTTQYPGGGAADRITLGVYDWRNRLVAIKEGHESYFESKAVNRPLTVFTYDTRDQITMVRGYDGDSFEPTTVNGVLSEISSIALRSKSEYLYDSLGQLYESLDYRVDQSNGTVGSKDSTKFWYDARGYLVKKGEAAGTVTDLRDLKWRYNSLGQLIGSYVTLQNNTVQADNNYANAMSLNLDRVHAQENYFYNDAGQVIQITSRVRTNEASASAYGELQNATTQPYARTSYTANYYDMLGRPTAFVDVGNNGGSAWTRPSNVPTGTDNILVNTVEYNSAGLPAIFRDARQTVYDKAEYDMLGRMKSFLEGYTVTGTAPFYSGGLSTSYTYDSTGRLFSLTLPTTEVVRLGYDSFGRVNQTTNLYGTAYQHTTTTAFDNLGNPTSVTDALGTITKMAYDVVGRPVSVTEAYGLSIARTQSATYDVFGRPLTSTDPRSKTTTFTYDDLLQKVSVTDPQLKTWTTTFDNLGRAVSSTNPLGKSTSITYDLLDRITKITDPLLHSQTATYFVNGDSDVFTDALNHSTTVKYDAFERVSSVSDPLLQKSSYTYDRLGNVTYATDPRGTQTRFGYDNYNRLSFFTEGHGTADAKGTTIFYNGWLDVSNIYHADGTRTGFGYAAPGVMVWSSEDWLLASELKTTYTVDVLGRTTSATAPGSRKTSFVYDELSRMTSITEGVGTALARTTSFTYDAADNLTHVTNPLGTVSHFTYDGNNRPLNVYEAYGTGEQIKSSMAYDAVGRVSSVTNPRGYATTFGYDDAGRNTSITDPLLKSTTFAYDEADRLVSVTNPLGKATTFTYDDADRITAISDPLLNKTQFGYDFNGNVTTVTDPRNNVTTSAYDKRNRLTSVTNALNETTSIAYDIMDNVTKVTNARGAVWTTAYDTHNRPITLTDPLTFATTLTYSPTTGDLTKITDPLLNDTTFGYDALGRQTTVTQPKTSTTTGTTTTAYDALDRVISVTDPMGAVTGITYDKLDRATKLTDALGKHTTFGYDANGNRTWLQDPLSNKTQFAYDIDDRLITETDPLNKLTTFTYDDADRLLTVTDRVGRKRQFTYDDAGRMTAEAWYNASSTLLQTQTFGYDAASNLTSATDPDGSYTISYDKLNRAEVVQGPFGYTQTFGYDKAGNRTSVTDNKSGTGTSTYDLANQLTSRTFTNGTTSARIDFTWTKRGELDLVTRYSDLAGTVKVGTTDYTNDAGGRLTGIVDANGSGTVLNTYSYAFDLADRMTQKTENGVATTYGYDKLGQVTQDGATSYSYDDAGNRTIAGYTTTAGNRTTAGNGWTYGFDDLGQVTSKTQGGTTWTYQYDLRGQMTQASSGGTTVNYAYDAFGNRIQRTQGGTVEKFVYDGWDTAMPGASGNENFNATADLDASGNVTARRMFGPGFDFMGARIEGSNTSWYLTDHLGSVRAVTNSSGAITGSQSFDAFGKATPTGTGLDRYSFTGREWDATLGLQHSRARMYDPGIGRWTSSDPIGFAAGDANLYRYVGNAATGATDPSGLVQKSGEAGPGSGVMTTEMKYKRQYISEDDFINGRWPKGENHVVRGPYVDDGSTNHVLLASEESGENMFEGGRLEGTFVGDQGGGGGIVDGDPGDEDGDGMADGGDEPSKPEEMSTFEKLRLALAMKLRMDAAMATGAARMIKENFEAVRGSSEYRNDSILDKAGINIVGGAATELTAGASALQGVTSDLAADIVEGKGKQAGERAGAFAMSAIANNTVTTTKHQIEDLILEMAGLPKVSEDDRMLGTIMMGSNRWEERDLIMRLKLQAKETNPTAAWQGETAVPVLEEIATLPLSAVGSGLRGVSQSGRALSAGRYGSRGIGATASGKFVTDRSTGAAATGFNRTRYTGGHYFEVGPADYPVFVSKNLPQSATMKQLLEGKLLPGNRGVTISDRSIQFDSLWKLSEMHGVEWALTRELDKAGNTVFRVYSGGQRWIHTPSDKIRQIAHTHPSGNPRPSWNFDVFHHNEAWIRYIESLPPGTPLPPPWPQRIIYGPGPYQLEPGGHITNTTRIFPFDGR